MRIAYVTHYDARDIRNYSGTATYAARALEEQGGTVAYVGPLKERLSLPLKVKQQFYRSVLRKEHHRVREPVILRGFARQIHDELRGTKADVVLSPSSLPASYLDADRPVVIWPDATFAALVDFYPEFTRLSRATLGNGHCSEQQALDRATLAIYSSEWAAASAVRDYGAAPDKIRVVPYGSNVDSERTPDQVRAMIKARPADVCRLLFVAKYWERKGGPKAYEVALALQQAGVPAELTILGCTPVLPASPSVRVLGFADKRTPEGRRMVEEAYSSAHFLILPTQADCTPIVLGEANAFGLPCLASDVGGISTIIRPHRNGRTFPLSAPAGEYVRFVAPLFEDYTRYQELAWRSYEEYRDRLSWDAAGRAVYELLRSVV